MTDPQKVYVIGYEGSITKMWYDHGYIVTRTPDEADIICFIGGADINPKLYNHKCHPRTHFYIPDDLRDQNGYQRSLDQGQRDQMKVGICRGGQFLNAMNGGTMYQHVDHHTSEHFIFDTMFRDTTPVKVTSAHHQMMIPHVSAEVLGYSEGIAKEVNDQDGPQSLPKFESEVLWYENTRSLCFQGHPEWNLMGKGTDPKGCTDYFFKLVEVLQ